MIMNGQTLWTVMTAGLICVPLACAMYSRWSVCLGESGLTPTRRRALAVGYWSSPVMIVLIFGLIEVANSLSNAGHLPIPWWIVTTLWLLIVGFAVTFGLVCTPVMQRNSLKPVGFLRIQLLLVLPWVVLVSALCIWYLSVS